MIHPMLPILFSGKFANRHDVGSKFDTPLGILTITEYTDYGYAQLDATLVDESGKKYHGTFWGTDEEAIDCLEIEDYAVNEMLKMLGQVNDKKQVYYAVNFMAQKNLLDEFSEWLKNNVQPDDKESFNFDLELDGG